MFQRIRNIGQQLQVQPVARLNPWEHRTPPAGLLLTRLVQAPAPKRPARQLAFWGRSGFHLEQYVAQQRPQPGRHLGWGKPRGAL